MIIDFIIVGFTGLFFGWAISSIFYMKDLNDFECDFDAFDRGFDAGMDFAMKEHLYIDECHLQREEE